jgi:zinc transporter 1/2/3
LILIVSIAGKQAGVSAANWQKANETPACAFPIVVKRFPNIRVPHHFLFLSRHFGTGVLIATAFVHLFPTAYVSLTDPCLPRFWNKDYPPMAGLIAMCAMFLVVGIEMFFAMRGAGHIHSSEFDNYTSEDGGGYHHANGHTRERSVSFRGLGATRAGGTGSIRLETTFSSEDLLAGRSPSVGNKTSNPQNGDDRGSGDLDNEDDELELDELGDGQAAGLLNGSVKHSHGADMLPMRAAETSIKPDEKALLQCLLLEAGILFHSVFIGMALSVTPAPAFYVLLVAISFHQTFEGLALGSRISALTFHPRSPQPWLMALAYGTTTPLGQAIGLAIHSAYDPESQTGLLSVGIMNSLSSGLLLFAGLVELLAADFLSDESYVQLRGKKRRQACIAVVLGAGLMALVGAWA